MSLPTEMWQMTRILLVALLCMIVIAPAASADDWPMFRRDLVHTGYVETTIALPLKELWHSQIGGLSSSPVVVGDRIYVGGVRGLYCLAAATGQEMWRVPTAQEVGGCPCVDAGRVYFGSGDWGGSQGAYYCIDAETGKALWQVPLDSVPRGAPAVSGGMVIFGMYSGDVLALNAETGQRAWRFANDEGGGENISSPAIAEGKVLIGVNPRLVCLDVQTGTRLWDWRPHEYVQASPVVADGIAYVGALNGKFAALKLADGTLVWETQLSGGVESSAGLADGRLYLGADKGQVFCLECGTGKVVWTYHGTDMFVVSSPAVTRDAVCILGAGADGRSDPNCNLYCLDRATGQVRWKTPGGGASSPAIADDTVYVICDNALRAFVPAVAP